MNSTSNSISFAEKIKGKIAATFAEVLIWQADHGIKHSPFPNISEAKYPVELMMEDTE